MPFHSQFIGANQYLKSQTKGARYEHEVLQTKRHFVDGKIIIGIDPSKKKLQAVALDPKGIPMGNSFSFKNTYEGFNEELWQKARFHHQKPSRKTLSLPSKYPSISGKNSVISCHKGVTVLLVSPMTTKYERKRISRNFSRTDPRDALLVANAARQGYYHFYREFSPQTEALHRLAITYDKLKKQLVAAKQRLMAQTELIFPELMDLMDIDTDSARYLLSMAMTPQDFKNGSDSRKLQKWPPSQGSIIIIKPSWISRKPRKKASACPWKALAHVAERLTMNVWLQQILVLRIQMNQVLDEMVRLAKQTPWYEILTSIKGISDVSASRFIAENRNLSELPHFKKIQAFAGMSLKIDDSGEYSGNRHITHIGNHRLQGRTLQDDRRNQESRPGGPNPFP